MSRRRWLLIGVFYVCLVGIGWLVGHWLTDLAVIDVRPSNEPAVHRMILTATGIFVAASAVPFVPGAEIGFALILAFGTPILFLVYVAMVCALVLAFLIGRFVPTRAAAAMFAFLGMRKAHDLVLKMAPLSAHERLSLLTAQAPTRFIPFLLRHRFFALAVVINLPGNTLIGGGGGIALAAGMSGLYPTLPFALTVALAVAPMPLLFLSTGQLLLAE
jgi:hypothetical protein